MKHHRAFDKRGVLAMRADLWGMLFGVEEPGEAFELRGNSAIVSIEGPLTHHAEWFWDSYDAIKGRVTAALESPADFVVLRIDSPGGDVSGCFETVRELRAMAAKAGKRIVSYADGMAASAGYALACAGDLVAVPETGFVGSIGVISTLVDTVQMDRARGLNFAVVASGERKRFGHPNVPLSDAAIANTQTQVDGLAELFFELVSEARGMPAAAVEALEAGVLFGAEAVTAKLADRVCTFDELLEAISSGNTTTPAGAAAEAVMGWKDEMKKAAEGGDEEAKKCLEAMDEEAPPESKKEGAEEPKEGGEDEPPPKKEGAAEEPPPEKPKDDDKAAARGGRHLRPVASVDERLTRIEDERERDRLLASRPDLPPALRSKLAAAPLDAVRWNVENLPRVAAEKPATPAPAPKAGPKTSPIAHAGAAVPGGTRGGSEGEPLSGVTRKSEYADKLDEQMGLKPPATAIRLEGNRLVMGVMSPDQARAELARRELAKKGAV